MSELAPAEQAAVDAVDSDELLADLRALVAIPSVDGTAAEMEVQRWCADRLRGLGMRVDEWDIDVDAERSWADFPGMEVERTAAVGCVGVLGGPAGTRHVGHGDPEPVPAQPALALCGHTDVVPPGDPSRWHGQDPFALEVVDGLAFGRGACDMKAGVAAMIGAVAALRRAGTELARPVALHCVSCEEDGGLGAFSTLRRGHSAEACIIAEPTNGTVIPANAGSLTFELVVNGRSTHGSTRNRGVSAIDKFQLVLEALHTLEARRNADLPPLYEHLGQGWPLSVGTVTAGDWASTVPDRLVASGRYGVRPGERFDTARAELEQALAEMAHEDPWLAHHPVEVTWPGGTFAPGSLGEGHRLLGDVRRAISDVTDFDAEVRGAPYGSDLRHYSAAGVPTLQFGPGHISAAHSINEQVSVAEMVDAARVYAVMMVRAAAAPAER